MANAEYEIQLYGFSLQQIALERRSLFRMRLNKAIGNVLEKAARATTNATTIELLQAQQTIVVQKIMDSMEENFKAFEILDQKYLKIPGHVLLESDFGHAKQYDENTEQELDAKIDELQKLYFENAVQSASLDQAETQFNAIKPYIDEQLKTQDQVRQCLQNADITNLSNLANETKSIIDLLRQENSN